MGIVLRDDLNVLGKVIGRTRAGSAGVALAPMLRAGAATG